MNLRFCTTVQSVMVRTVSPWAAALEPEAQSAEKIMRTYELCGGRLHGGQIQRRPDPVAGVKQKGIIHPRVQQVVVIGLGVGGVPRMKAVRHGRMSTARISGGRWALSAGTSFCIGTLPV